LLWAIRNPSSTKDKIDTVFLRFLTVFQECEEWEINIKQIEWERGPILDPLPH